MQAIRRLRCERCGIVDPNHPDANKTGGMPVHDHRGRWLCLVCRDVLVRGA